MVFWLVLDGVLLGVVLGVVFGVAVWGEMRRMKKGKIASKI